MPFLACLVITDYCNETSDVCNHNDGKVSRLRPLISDGGNQRGQVDEAKAQPRFSEIGIILTQSGSRRERNLLLPPPVRSIV